MTDFSTVLLDTKGAPIDDGGAPLTLRRACIIALDIGLQKDQNEGLSPKLKRGKLIEVLSTEAPANLSSEEVSLLKERVALTFTSASVVRQICLLLDPATKD
jgi:hypothetical protein